MLPKQYVLIPPANKYLPQWQGMRFHLSFKLPDGGYRQENLFHYVIAPPDGSEIVSYESFKETLTKKGKNTHVNLPEEELQRTRRNAHAPKGQHGIRQIWGDGYRQDDL